MTGRCTLDDHVMFVDVVDIFFYYMIVIIVTLYVYNMVSLIYVVVFAILFLSDINTNSL